jgi:hypothetical protein
MWFAQNWSAIPFFKILAVDIGTYFRQQEAPVVTTVTEQ